MILMQRKCNAVARRSGMSEAFGYLPQSRSVWQDIGQPVAVQTRSRRRTGRVRVESSRGVEQIARNHDVVAFEDRARFVPGQLHRDTLGTPARTRFRTAVRRKSWGMRAGQPAATRAFRHALL